MALIHAELFIMIECIEEVDTAILGPDGHVVSLGAECYDANGLGSIRAQGFLGDDFEIRIRQDKKLPGSNENTISTSLQLYLHRHCLGLEREDRLSDENPDTCLDLE